MFTVKIKSNCGTTTTGFNLFPSTMSGFSGVVVDLEVKVGSWGSLGRRGDDGEVGELLRVEEPEMSLLSGTSRPLLLRLTAGLGAVIPTDCSKTLPKLPEGGNKRRGGFYMCHKPHEDQTVQQDRDRTGVRVELHWKRNQCHQLSLF